MYVDKWQADSLEEALAKMALEEGAFKVADKKTGKSGGKVWTYVCSQVKLRSGYHASRSMYI